MHVSEPMVGAPSIDVHEDTFIERHWFVAAIPEDARGVAGVRTAKEALQPELVRAALGRARPKDPFRRRNAAYVRQGEWFFVPAPEPDPPDDFVLRNEPLTRGRGKPHTLQFAYRTGGQTVWANRTHATGISEARSPFGIRITRRLFSRAGTASR